MRTLLTHLLAACGGGWLVYAWFDGKRRYDEGIRSIDQWRREKERYLSVDYSEHGDRKGPPWRA